MTTSWHLVLLFCLHFLTYFLSSCVLCRHVKLQGPTSSSSSSKDPGENLRITSSSSYSPLRSASIGEVLCYRDLCPRKVGYRREEEEADRLRPEEPPGGKFGEPNGGDQGNYQNRIGWSYTKEEDHRDCPQSAWVEGGYNPDPDISEATSNCQSTCNWWLL